MLRLFLQPLTSTENRPMCSEACSTEFVTGCFEAIRSYAECREQATSPLQSLSASTHVLSDSTYA